MSAGETTDLKNIMAEKRALLKRVAALVPPVRFRGLERFYDIGPLLRDNAALMFAAEYLASQIEPFHPTAIAGVDARGFLFAPLIAMVLGLPCVMIRKQGKLPNEAAVSSGYEKEYAEKSLERLAMQTGSIGEADRVVIVDDIIATGGTLVACKQVVEAMGASVAAHCCIVHIVGLGAAKKLKAPIVDLVSERLIAKTVQEQETGEQAEKAGLGPGTETGPGPGTETGPGTGTEAGAGQ